VELQILGVLEMSFVLGLAIGLAIGCLAMHAVHEYLDYVLAKDEAEMGEK
jgi:predicted lysophospholipase L1 biosynthesis ABC-type transport system permease subunit